jgi:ATP sulfurylase
LKDQDLIDEKIIPQLDIQIAVDNMISYCCEINGITNKETCPKLKND